ncbi:MAG: GNAT family N-acetyltransferase [Crocinitomicaceae bacterium]
MISLRPANESDIDLILKWENNPTNWSYSDTNEPYSRIEIENLIEALGKADSEQQRFMICAKNEKTPIGTLDIFEIDKAGRSASVGVLIESDENRRKGYALFALSRLEELCDDYQIEKLNASVHDWNMASLNLFKKAGYTEVGLEKDLVKFEKCLKK